MIRCPHCGKEFEPRPLAELPPLDGLSFRRRYRVPASLHPTTEGRALDLARHWHQKVTRISVLNQARFAAIAARLEDGYAVDACRAAVECYGADKWHREKAAAGSPAWLDLADFFKVKVLERWIVTANEQRLAREKLEHARPPAPAVRRLCKDVAAALPEADVEARRVRDWNRLALADRKRFWARAETELAAKLGARPPQQAVMPAAWELMDQERAGATGAAGGPKPV
jgi:hypothetical protein